MSTEPPSTFEGILDDAAASHPAPAPNAPTLAQDVAQLVGVDVAPAQPGDAPTVSAPPMRLLDKRGNEWNPARHVTPPTTTARGTWKLLRGAGDGAACLPAPTAPPAPAAPAPGQVSTPAPLPTPPPINTRAQAEAWADCAFGVLASVIDPIWKPADAERENIIAALDKWMIASGFTADLTPGWALVIAVGTYSLPRALHPATKQRIGKLVAARKAAKLQLADAGGDVDAQAA